MIKLNKQQIIVLIVGILFLSAAIIVINQKTPNYIDMETKNNNAFFIQLPEPVLTGEMSLEEAIAKRRSVRIYKDAALTLEEVSQLLWAAQGITAPEFGGRAAPSAGALYPLELYLTVHPHTKRGQGAEGAKINEVSPRYGVGVKNAEGITAGVYRYLPETHKLVRILEGDVGGQLAGAALGQTFIAEAPVNLVFAGVFARTTARYDERGIQYVYMEAGHAAQNVYLQAESLGLGTVVAGAFSDQKVKKILKMPVEETPLYIMPVGKK